MDRENTVAINNNNLQEEDKHLIERCRKGDRQAFNRLMLKYHRRIFNTAFRMLGNYEQADEVAQDVFVRAYRGIVNFRQEAGFLTWLYVITVNLSRNRIKKNCRVYRTTESLDEPLMEGVDSALKKEIPDIKLMPDKVLLDKEKEAFIQQAINELADDFCMVVILRDVQLCSYEEITQILRINSGTLKSRLSRARAMLREKLKDVIGDGL